jgi:hypothetical protein
VARTEQAIERVLGFLVQDAGIPHLRLLPYSSPLTVLSTFFDRFPTPSERARRLLTRWLWRGISTHELRGDGKGMRPALDAVRSAPDDEHAAKEVLGTVSSERPATLREEAFNIRHASSRLLAITLAGLAPRDLLTGEPLDVPALLDSEEIVFPQIVGHKPPMVTDEEARAFSTVGNRLLHPVPGDSSLLALLEKGTLPSAVLASHGINRSALRLLHQGDRFGFLSSRSVTIEAAAEKLVASHAEWGHSNRPSIASMASAED